MEKKAKGVAFHKELWLQ